MNNYDDWSQLVAKNLTGEANLIAAIDKDELDDAAAKQAFIRAVLEPFLPESYAIGSGRVVDAFGTYSEHLDIIIYNRDFPRIGLRGTHSVYLYESVLAAVVVKAKLIRKAFFEALDSSASLAALDPNIDKTVLRKLANKNGMALNQHNEYIHTDPMRSARFKMIGRPPLYVYAFSGMKHSYHQLEENITLWLEHRDAQELQAEMKSLPAVIATQGSFAWRNAAPLALSNRRMMGIGNDSAPVRLIVLQLLHLMNRRLSIHTDGYGLKPNLNKYLSQFAPPAFESSVGSLIRKPKTAQVEKPAAQAQRTDTVAPQAASKATPVAEVAPAAAVAVAKDAAKLADVRPPITVAPPKPPVDFPLFADEEVNSAENKQPKSSFGSPMSSSDDFTNTVVTSKSSFGPPKSSSEPVTSSSSSSFGPPKSSSEPVVSSASSSFGSPMSSSEPVVSSASSSFGSPKSGSEPVASASKSSIGSPQSSSDDFINTVVISNNSSRQSNGASHGSNGSGNSAQKAQGSSDAFISRVKQQLSTPEPFPQFQPQNEPEPDPFSSTIPQ